MSLVDINNLTATFFAVECIINHMLFFIVTPYLELRVIVFLDTYIGILQSMHLYFIGSLFDSYLGSIILKGNIVNLSTIVYDCIAYVVS